MNPFLFFNLLCRALDGLSSFVKLEELVLDNNELTDQAMSAFPNMPALHTLSANKNKVRCFWMSKRVHVL